jgi:hypothetical protein
VRPRREEVPRSVDIELVIGAGPFLPPKRRAAGNGRTLGVVFHRLKVTYPVIVAVAKPALGKARDD